jgi:regulator of nonsense transcripts 1
LGKYEEAERVLLDGLDDPNVLKKVRDAQESEVRKFKKEGGKSRTRMMIHKSRLIFGVCEPYGVLREGQVHIRVATENGESTPINVDVLVVRNPCLHPGLSVQAPVVVISSL